MKMAEIRSMSEKELTKKIESIRSDIATARRDRYTSDEKNVHKTKHMRRDLARLLTERNDRKQNSTEEEK